MIANRQIASNRIMVVDDHEAARCGIRWVLAADPTLDVVCEAADAEEALAKVQELRPDIILLDISLPGESGIQAAAKVRAFSPESRIIFVSQHDSVQIARRDLIGTKVIGFYRFEDFGFLAFPR